MSKLSRNKPGSLFPYLHRFLKPYYPRIAFASVLVVVSVLLEAFPVRILGRLIDALKSGQANASFIIESALTILGMSLGAAILLFVQRRWITESSRFFEYDARKAFLDELHLRSPDFFLRNRTGDILSLATNDLGQVREMIGAGILHLFRTVVNLIVMLIMMFSISPYHSAVSLIPVVLTPLVSWRLLRTIGRNYAGIQERLGRINNTVQETFAGIGEVKAYGLADWRQRCFDEEANGYCKASLKQAQLTGLLWPLFGLLASSANLVLLFVAGRSVIRGELSLGSLVAMSVYLGLISWPLISIGWVANLFQRGTASARRLSEFLAQPDPFDRSGTSPFVRGDIEIKEFSFTYPSSEHPALTKVSMRFPEGKVVAVVGTVGSGKTTLLNAIPRLLDTPAETIYMNETDVLKLNLRELRERIGIVPQETLLFSDTIRNNIRFGSTESEDIFNEAIRVSRIDKDLASIQDGADAMLGERGVNLSGGQRQRVAIARALMRNPDILLLDDCLSAVDADTEAEILASFESYFKGRTIVMVSHRFGVVRNADYIFVMDKGRVTEEGTHESLMEQQGLYVRLYEKQRLEESL